MGIIWLYIFRFNLLYFYIQYLHIQKYMQVFKIFLCKSKKTINFLSLIFSPSTFIIVEAVEAICIEMNKNGVTMGEQFRVRRGDIFFIPPMSTLRFLSAKSSVHGYRTYSFEVNQIEIKRKKEKL